ADFLDTGSDISAVISARRIVSFHGTDEDPIPLWQKFSGDWITKIALDTPDYERIFQLLKLNEDSNAICFAMGEVGAFSRIISVFKGAEWIYTSLPSKPTASGQFTIGELLNLYRVKRFSKIPEVFGILGNPVSHSKSPLFHNEKFAERNLPWIYLPFLCKDLDSLLTHAEQFGIRGLSVTHPFKEAIIRHLKTKSKEVELLRSCNTVFRKNNEWHGINTDIDGFEALLRKNQIELQGLRVAILGAGGAARAAAYVGLQHGAELIFINRTHSKAEMLAAIFNGTAVASSGIGSVEYDVLVQATPVGMQSNDAPVNTATLRPRTVVIETIYEPKETLLLQKARELGCKTVNGEEWFYGQAEAQLDWWMDFYKMQ
ncbi:MAG TPA: type I 3-dehydroquinate dehydratase, partial [Acidobacteriota bacterium]|nr:type I 3-dehydroquinate dehydratase [Acidobacteriota bacterium]